MALTKVIGAGAEGLTLSSTSLTVANGLTLTDGDVTLASGHGLNFAATADTSVSGASMASELLHDYEEGTWTPSWSNGFTSLSYALQRGSYSKVGSVVLIQGDLKFTGTNAGAQLVLTGLPFTAAASNNGYASSTAAIGYSTISTYANSTTPNLYVSPGSQGIYFYAANGGVVSSNANASNDWIQFSAVYQTES